MNQAEELIEFCRCLALSRMQMEVTLAIAMRDRSCNILVELGMAEDRVRTLEKCVKEMTQP
jgi:hypothetical protein